MGSLIIMFPELCIIIIDYLEMGQLVTTKTYGYTHFTHARTARHGNATQRNAAQHIHIHNTHTHTTQHTHTHTHNTRTRTHNTHTHAHMNTHSLTHLLTHSLTHTDIHT